MLEYQKKSFHRHFFLLMCRLTISAISGASFACTNGMIFSRVYFLSTRSLEFDRIIC
jgi:hypothetical protein